MSDLSGIDWGSIPTATDYSAIPAGMYNAQITKAEVVDTKTGGQMLKMTFSILDGKYASRLIFTQFNIKNANPVAQQIGLGLLNGLRVALKKQAINNTQELINEKVQIKVSVYENTYNGETSEKNDVKAFKAIESLMPTVAAKADDAAGLPWG